MAKNVLVLQQLITRVGGRGQMSKIRFSKGLMVIRFVLKIMFE